VEQQSQAMAEDVRFFPIDAGQVDAGQVGASAKAAGRSRPELPLFALIAAYFCDGL
jgi:hypothetical protein